MCCCNKRKNLEVKFSKHHCTDPLCCALFAVVWFISIIVFIASRRTADITILTNGRDYQGNVCGSAKSNPGSKKLGCDKGICTQLYYPRINEDQVVTATYNLSISLYGICLPACPLGNSVVCSYNYTDTKEIPDFSEALQCSDLVYRMLHREMCENCWAVPVNTTSVLNRCIPSVTVVANQHDVCYVPESPDDPNDPNWIDPNSPACLAKRTILHENTIKASNTDLVTEAVMNAQVIVGRWLGDIESSTLVIIICSVASLVMGFIFLFFLKACSRCIIWTILVLGLVVCVLATILFYYKGGVIPLNAWFDWVVLEGDKIFHWGNATFDVMVEAVPDFLVSAESTKGTWLVIAYIMTAITLIMLFVVIAMGHAVNVSIAIMKEASKAISRIPTILVIPIMETIFAAILTAYFVLCLVYSSSSSLSIADYTNELISSVSPYIPSNATNYICQDPVNMINCTQIAETYENLTTNQVIIFFFHFFVFCWSVQFVYAIGVMAVAGTVGKWYFSDPDGDNKATSKTLWQALLCAVTFHMGSAAFGSLIIAIIQLFRAIMMYLDRKFQTAQKENPLVKCGFKCCHCCLWCLEKCMKYISRNAYILIINRSYNFLTASTKSFGLIAGNIGTITVLKGVSTLFIWMGKLIICGASVALMLLLVFNAPSLLAHPLISVVPSAILTAIIAYIISTIFISVFVITLDTVMLCYCEDRQNDNGEGLQGVIDWSKDKKGKKKKGDKEEAPKEAPQEAPQEVPQEIPKEAPQEAPKETPKGKMEYPPPPPA